MAEVVRDVPAATAAKAMGVSRAALSKWTNKRRPAAPHRREGRRCFYNLVELERWRNEHGLGETGGYRTRAGAIGSSRAPAAKPDAGDDGEASPGDLKQQIGLADLRKKLAEAERKELELGELRGDLLRREDVERAQLERVSFAQAVLMGGPTNLAPDLVRTARRAATADDAVEPVERLLREWRDRALKELAGQ